MPSALTILLLLSLALIFVCTAWSAQQLRHPATTTISKAALWAFAALTTFAILRIQSGWAIPLSYGGELSNLLVPLLAIAAPVATCHLVCQAARRRGVSTKVAAALGITSGVAAMALTVVPAVLASCGLAGECA